MDGWRYSGNDNLANPIEKLYKNNYNFSEKVKTHSLFCNSVKVNIETKNISSQYKKYLSQNVENYQLLMMKGTLPVDAILLGYDDKELKRMFEKNGCTEASLKNNEVVELDYVYSSGMDSREFRSPFHEQDIISFQYGDKSSDNIKIAKKVKGLTIYPDTENLTMVFATNLRNFEKITEKKVFESVFIEQISEVKDIQNLELLKSKKNYTTSFPAKEAEQLLKMNQVLDIFVYIVFGLCISVAIILLYSSYYLKIHIHKKEYAMLYTIGLNIRKVQKIVLYEMLLSYLLAILGAFFASYFITKKILLVKYPEYGFYLYHFPYANFFTTCLITLVISAIVWYIILKKLKKVLDIHVLQAL